MLYSKERLEGFVSREVVYEVTGLIHTPIDDYERRAFGVEIEIESVTYDEDRTTFTVEDSPFTDAEMETIERMLVEAL